MNSRDVISALTADGWYEVAQSLPVSSRLKPVSARIARWAGHFLAAAWDLDEVAYLFGVGPEDLAASLSRGA